MAPACKLYPTLSFQRRSAEYVICPSTFGRFGRIDPEFPRLLLTGTVHVLQKVISFVGAGAVATAFVVGAFCAIPL